MDYKSTLNLPRTAFPMKANLPKLEPEMLERWEAADIYGRIRQASAKRPLWILHDGPPYANGHIHMGTALNKILKDFIVKSRTMLGQNAVYVPGWDCHGLPIEHQVDKELGLDTASLDVRRAMDPVEKIRRCREYAAKFIDIQRDEFRRLGVFGDWKHPYITMEPAYQATIVREFGRFVGRGMVYKGLKPVHWCMHCKTALAQAEVEYEDQTTPSVYVKFPVKAPSPALARALGGRAASLVIWTTTPWTLPANLAIAVHPGETYTAIEVGGEWLIVAQALAEPVGWLDGVRGRAQAAPLALPGAALDGTLARHPWIEREVPVIPADFVAMDTGTGLVHIAPGHGEEDYELGRKAHLRVYNPVDDDGRFKPEVAHFGGLTVWEANPRIIEHLRRAGALVASVEVEHTYPHCWRCKNPTLFLATEQWFIALDQTGLRQKTLEAIRREVRWIPPWGEERIFNMVAHRPEWVISRQRVWGVPIVAFYCERCGGLLLEERLVEHVAAIMRAGRGADEWHAREAADLLPAGTVCGACGGASFRKETDILDVWFDSGCSHAAVLETRPDLRWPADMYLEGSDQHRGWFHSSLLEAVGTRDKPPYRSVLTHGFVVDGEGRKMSKSQGNYVTPEELLPKYGAEVLRLWVAAEDYTEDIRLSDEILTRLAEAYRRVRNTCRFLLGALADFDPDRDRISYARMDELDRWALSRLGELIARVRKAYDAYEFHVVFHAAHNFCAVELSALYLDIIKDRLYVSAPDDPRRRAAQTVCFEVLTALTRLLAPILTFTADEVWGHIPGSGKPQSVHLTLFPEERGEWLDERLAADWDRLLEVRGEVSRALEGARKAGRIGKGLDAVVHIVNAPEEQWLPLLESKGEALLAALFNVSGVRVKQAPPAGAGLAYESQDIPGLLLTVVPAQELGWKKCERCWMWSGRVGEDAAHPTLCERCAPIVRSLG
ncbi:MAG: isoleucine--tRNA ligase [Candidatus Rokubacteria bacterium GWC2_70_16]|nr:MAG: isoleucine--tRNA ligase [Candidatus Rokubacteria bacterium GWC2_70_16]